MHSLLDLVWFLKQMSKEKQLFLSFESQPVPDGVNVHRAGAYFLGLLRYGKKVRSLHSSFHQPHMSASWT